LHGIDAASRRTPGNVDDAKVGGDTVRVAAKNRTLPRLPTLLIMKAPSSRRVLTELDYGRFDLGREAR
jgi:hypothetical protein